MKRVVYSPKISAYIKADSGIYDLTNFIVDFSVDRKINQVSSAELTIRNPHKVWTNVPFQDAVTGEAKIGPRFHPMDPITIFMERIAGRPVQVFTGYCDTTPYLQLFPGTVTIKASCTLKRLLYTYFDPGLPFMIEYLRSYGWESTPGGTGIVNPSAEKATLKKGKEEKETDNTKAVQNVQYGDSGIGELLFHILVDIGKWPEDAIYIQEMPSSVVELVSNLFEMFKAEGEEGVEEVEKFLSEIITTASVGKGGTNPASDTGQSVGDGKWVRVGATEEGQLGNPENTAGGGPGGMTFAELLIAGANADLKDQALYKVLGIPEGPEGFGMAFNTPIQVRMPGSTKVFTMYKNDNGSGQGGDPHYKVDLQSGIIQALGWTPNEDIEVRRMVSTKELKNHNG